MSASIFTLPLYMISTSLGLSPTCRRYIHNYMSKIHIYSSMAHQYSKSSLHVYGRGPQLLVHGTDLLVSGTPIHATLCQGFIIASPGYIIYSCKLVPSCLGPMLTLPGSIWVSAYISGVHFKCPRYISVQLGPATSCQGSIIIFQGTYMYILFSFCRPSCQGSIFT